MSEEKITLGVIFGGQSSEYSVSLHSAGSMLRSLHDEKYNVVAIGIAPDGRFYHFHGTLDELEHDHWVEHSSEIAWVHEGIVSRKDGSFTKLDVVFPILHGKNGEDGCIQGMMEMLNIPCAGCDVLSSALCMDKEIMHILADAAGIPAAPYICLKKNEPMPSFEEIEQEIALPWVVKPCSAGSSYGVSFVEDKAGFDKAVEEAFHYDGRGKILVEKAVDGFEIGCAVMGDDTLFAGSVDEIETAGKVFDFEGKYAMKESAIYCPARISEEKFEQARELAKKVYKALNCMGMARVDMFVVGDDIILNEVNTIPGLTATSRYPSMMKEAGKEFGDLLDELIALGHARPVGVC